MKSFSWSLILLVLCIVRIQVSAQTTKEEVARSIGIDQLHHPYLYFSDEEKPRILQRIQSDPESRDVMKRLVAEGNRYLRKPFQRRVIQQPAHPRFEPKNEALSYLSEASNGALTLAFLYQMTGDETYARRAIDYAEAVCDVPEWRNAAHAFDIIYPRVWPWNVTNDQVVFSYDLNSARVARTLAASYDWLYPAMTRQQRDKIRNGLLEKAVTRVRGNSEFFWWSTAYRCNWSAICYSGVGIAALALLTESPQLTDIISESCNKMTLTFDQIGDEGGWQEGRGYYSYMMTSSAYFMDALKRMTKGRLNMFRHPKIQANAFDFQLYALTAAFGDSEKENGGPTFAVNKYVAETGSATSAYYRENFLGAGEDIFDIIWPRSTVQAREPAHASRVFKNIDWAILRSGFADPSTVTIAAKAGFNDDPHHGHLDCGHFTVTWQNVPFIRDLGRMKYDEQYFNEERFDYLYASSEGHNVISVNGEGQIVAKLKDSAWKPNVGGRILDYRSDDKQEYIVMDPTHAYPGRELKKWRRSIVLEKPVVTLVLDEVSCAPGATIAARFFPGVGSTIRKDHVLLTDNAGHSMALIPIVHGNESRIVGDKAASLVVANDAVLEWMPYVETLVTVKAGTTVIATVILPVENAEDARRKAASAKMSISDGGTVTVGIDGAGRPMRWVFEKRADGFVLK